jgi:tripartite-type tricarboxylate transporter receptor subunit TctC
MLKTRRILPLLLLAVATLPAAAQNYPDRPIKLVSPNPVGGANDTVVRIITAKMATQLGQPFVIENRGGAGGKIGADLVAHAQADGYTLLAGSVSTHSFAPVMSLKLSYDPIKDFAPISLFSAIPNVLIVGTKVPANSVKELIDLAKSKPGTLNYASGGIGSTSHFAVAMFVAQANLGDVTVHVPYKGGAPALTAMMAGEAQFYFGPIAGMVPYIQAGSVKPLAISGDARSQFLPDVPTMAEVGFPQYKSVGWFGLFAPAGTNPAIVNKLSAAVAEAIKDPQVTNALSLQGIEATANSPTVFSMFVNDQLELHRRLAKDMKLELIP